MKKIEDLLKNIDKVELGIFPTPLYRLKNFEKHLNYNPIFIKRDDITSLGPGGNKIRSLEYILGDALKNNCDSVIVSGPLQSNLCTLTACACAKLNLKCYIVHNGKEPKEFTGNLLLNKLLGTESYYLENSEEDKRNLFVDELYNKLEKERKKPFIIKNGASTGHGALGYVNAVVEIFKQCNERNLNIKEIFAPGGNGGVATGLIYGNYILGSPFKINIISVEYDKGTLLNNILSIMKEVEKIAGIKFQENLIKTFSIFDDYKGLGWGENTLESSNMVYDFPKMEGIFIENIYNSKVIIGLMDIINKSKVCEGVCYIHTGGFGSLFSQF